MTEKIKIFPDIGDAYIITFPNGIPPEGIDMWINENLNFVNHWEHMEG